MNTQQMKALADQFECHAASQGLDQIELAGKMMREAVAEIERLRIDPAQLNLPEVATCTRSQTAAQAQQGEPMAPSVEDAYVMGAEGGPIVEAERLAFESWMRGHCWALCAAWCGTHYKSHAEEGGDLDPRAMSTRRLWAAWRDRAALSVAPQLLEALRMWVDIHDTPAGFAGKYGKALDDAIAAQQAKVDAAVGASRAAIAQACGQEGGAA